MKVLLKEDVDTLGYAGEVHDVANGYGRNYLIPRGLAVKATPGVLKQARAWRERAEARRAERRAHYEELTEKINDIHLNFRAKAGETGRLYGSVTMMDVADRLNEELGTEIDRRKFDSEPLRELGEHRVPIHLDRDFHPQLLVFVHPEGAETEEADEAAEDAAQEEAAQEETAQEETAQEETAQEETVQEEAAQEEAAQEPAEAEATEAEAAGEAGVEAEEAVVAQAVADGAEDGAESA